MFLFTVFAAAIALVFALHAFVLRKALNEHEELMAISWNAEDNEG